MCIQIHQQTSPTSAQLNNPYSIGVFNKRAAPAIPLGELAVNKLKSLLTVLCSISLVNARVTAVGAVGVRGVTVRLDPVSVFGANLTVAGVELIDKLASSTYTKSPRRKKGAIRE